MLSDLSGQLGLAKGLLARYSWWKLEARPDLVEPRWSTTDYWQPYAGQIPGEVIFVFSPSAFKPVTLKNLEAVTYRGFFFNPSDGDEVPIESIQPDSSGTWKPPEFPIFRDWVIVLERKA